MTNIIDNITVDKITDTEANKEALLSIAQVADAWDGSFDWADVYSDLDDMLPDMKPSKVANLCYYGDYNPNADWHRLDGNGNVESIDNDDLLKEAWDYIDDIIEWLNDNQDNTFDNIQEYADRLTLTE